MYMTKERTLTLRLFNDDGSELEPEKSELVHQLMDTFKGAKVNGGGSQVADIQAMRMAIAVLNEWDVQKRKTRE